MTKVFWGDPIVICPLGKNIEEIISKITSGEVAYEKYSENEVFSGFPSLAVGKIHEKEESLFEYRSEKLLDSLLSKKELIAHKDADAVLMYYKSGSYFEYSSFQKNLPELEIDSAFKVLKSNNFSITKNNIFIFDNTCTSGLSLLTIAKNGISSRKWSKVLVIAIDLIELRELFSIYSLGAVANVANSNDKYLEKPFDKKRNGFIKTESLSAAVITSDASCLNLKLGRVASYEQTNDAYRITDGRDDSKYIIKSMEGALEKARLTAGDISFVKSHGTGTKLNDLHEANAILKVFGSTVPIISLKGSLGHTTDASGLVESILASYEFCKGKMIPTFGCEDSEFKLNIIKKHKDITGKYFMANAFGFGGNNLSVIFEI